MRWTLLTDPEGHPGRVNMATDDALLRQAQQGVGFLRVYRWDPGCLSFGRNEPALRRYNRQAIESMGLDTVRRPTGGRAVWHEHEVTYAVAAPTEWFGSLRQAYRSIHDLICTALQALGADVALADGDRPTPGLGSGACFASPAGGEVLYRNRKLVGSAQIRRDHAFLQHGSILLDDGQDIVTSVSKGDVSPHHAVGLNTVLGHDVAFEDVARALHDAASHGWPGEWSVKHGVFIESQCYNYGDPEWTWRR